MIKKILILLLFSVQCFGASRYWVGGHPTNNNWNQTGSGTTNWTATSGGAGGAGTGDTGEDARTEYGVAQGDAIRRRAVEIDARGQQFQRNLDDGAGQRSALRHHS